jgi:amino acid transporter
MDQPSQGQLRRRLGLSSAIAITVGAVIGSGIFMKPLEVGQGIPGETWIFATWIVLGIVCLFGAFAYAELGAMLPEAGGQYSFLREGWGRFPAFLYGWTFFWVINSGTMAALALAFADNLLPLAGIDPQASPAGKVALAGAMIVVLAVVNHVGVGVGAVVQNVSTLCKLGALAMIVGAGFLSAGGASGELAPATVPAIEMPKLIAACVAIFWAYEGWYQLPFNAAELRRPERDLPLGLVLGLLLLIAVYVLMNAVYLRVVPLEEMVTLQNAADVPRLTVARAIDPTVAGYLSLLIAVSVFGAANPNLLSSPRAFYEMARDGLVPSRLMHVSLRFGTPTVSIWTQALVGIVIVAGFRSFKDVTVYVVFAALVFYALTVAVVYRLRRREPARARPFCCPGYPWTPALFIAAVLFVDVQTLLDPNERDNALIGLCIIATGIPAYFALRRR